MFLIIFFFSLSLVADFLFLVFGKLNVSTFLFILFSPDGFRRLQLLRPRADREDDGGMFLRGHHPLPARLLGRHSQEPAQHTLHG